MEAASEVRLGKRLIICCDGTWKNSDGDVQFPSNVTRICRCIKQEAIEESTGRTIPQIIYYQSGVGTNDSLYSRLVGGATGKGISEHIREAYSFICNNYFPGDEIFILGFSRGAFTARSLSSLIRAIGLLTPHGLSYFYQIFQDWEFQDKAGWKTPYPNQPWPDRPKVSNPEYGRKLLELELTRPDIPIKCVAVWDTVGSLGIPRPWFLPNKQATDYSFVDTKVEPNIEYAFQALGLDEHRRPYTPTIWEKPSGQELPRILKQCWFPGVHSDIGGSYHDDSPANITLAWMISQLDPLLAFDHSYIIRRNRISMEQAAESGKPIREWGAGKIHDSMSFLFWLGGSKVRTPMEYYSASKADQAGPRRRLHNTNEYIHSSVRIRMGRQGLGPNDKGIYDPAALKGWTMNSNEAAPSPTEEAHLRDEPASGPFRGKMSNVRWIKPLPHDKETPELIMQEDELGDLEKMVLETWPEIYHEFATIRPGRHASNIRRSSTYPNDHSQSAPGAEQRDDAGDAAGGKHRPDKPPTRMSTI